MCVCEREILACFVLSSGVIVACNKVYTFRIFHTLMAADMAADNRQGFCGIIFNDPAFLISPRPSDSLARLCLLVCFTFLYARI